ncbi:rhamnan synthesis F family protein [Rhizobium sp. RM]|uniref:rhamnan synthesis F family protein n=1 Tax=Rhizobium sp. RM TaxID=2748079 RepID=UPI00110E9B6A|nr:rhamnan synthesis F family protein [Rhizobium sp. RM]NWJ27277.1 hypothetical protein [Rhizobium sp. RM]TMV20337.1 hypothetical protein BJG94_09945 [Rhizobium sp. Td3]
MKTVLGGNSRIHIGDHMTLLVPKRITTRKVTPFVRRERGLAKRLERYIRHKIRSQPTSRDNEENAAGWESRVTNFFIRKPLQIGKAVAIYAHFNPAATVSRMVVEQLRALNDQGFEVIFVTMSPVSQESVRNIEGFVSIGFERRSFGRDLGAWKDAWTQCQTELLAAPEILLTNDSILGPVRPFPPILAALRTVDHGVLGLTDSPDHVPHLQSYFLLFRGRNAILSLDAFFEQLRCSFSKKVMIERGELALSTFLVGKRVPLYTLFSYDELEADYLNNRDRLRELLASSPHLLKDLSQNEEKLLFADDVTGGGAGFSWIRMRMKARFWGTAFNPTHYFWRHLVLGHGFPFIKTELVTSNPSYVFDAADWRDVICDGSPVSIQDIEDHINLVVSGS